MKNHDPPQWKYVPRKNGNKHQILKAEWGYVYMDIFYNAMQLN